MNAHSAHGDTYARMPRLWRGILVALGTLILCSCRATDRSMTAPGMARQGPPALPQQASTGVSTAGYVVAEEQAPAGPPGWELGVPLPYTPTGPWVPPGIAKPWPQDEYLADGGDGGVKVKVTDNRQMRGLEMEDTVAQYDTPEGRTLVEPSNQVFLYSPRFRAVRQVVGVRQNDQMLASTMVLQPVRLASHGDVAMTGAAKQNVRTVRQIGQKSVTTFRSRQQDGAISTALGLAAFQDGFKPYENLVVIRTGKLEAAEIAWLARGTTAAITWSSDQAVQVILDRQVASAVVSDQKTDVVYSVDKPPARPKLRIIKVASTPFAEVGDTVDFTIRFDNVGNQVIGNVAIVDSLTTRLEYVEDSAQCSLPAAFSTSRNEGDSLVLRCEVSQPLEPGHGGVLRFTCRVR